MVKKAEKRLKFTKAKLNVLLWMLPVVAMFSFLSCGDDDDSRGFPTVNGKEGDHTYVDLGLSVRWATYNIGATKQTEYGAFFAWGETSPKEEYWCDTYKWGGVDRCGGYVSRDSDKLTKYNTKESYGFVDNKTQLDLEDDAAAVNWKGKWRMPTASELQELIDGCDWNWTDDMNGSGIAGSIGVSKKNGNVIFFPAAGYRDFDNIKEVNYSGSYWSASLYSDKPTEAYCYTFEPDLVFDVDGDGRDYGTSVRAVCPSAR